MNGLSVVSDTNPLIYLLNGSQKAASYLDGKQVWISVISELELFGKRGLSNAEYRFSTTDPTMLALTMKGFQILHLGGADDISAPAGGTGLA